MAQDDDLQIVDVRAHAALEAGLADIDWYISTDRTQHGAVGRSFNAATKISSEGSTERSAR